MTVLYIYIYIFFNYILAYIQHNRDVSLEKKKARRIYPRQQSLRNWK